MREIGEGDKRFRKPGKRHLSNVLDRADNRVKLLDYGSDLLNKFTALHQRVRNQATFQPMNVWEFDLNIISLAGKEAKDVQRTVFPSDDQGPLAAELQALPIFDLTLVQRPMPEEYQERLLQGEDLLEILKDLSWERPVPTVSQG